MKWHRFKGLHRRYPWLVDILDPLGNKRYNQRTYRVEEENISLLRDHIEGQLDYIAFRPWHSIDPCSPKGWYETTTTLEYALRCDTYFGGDLAAVYAVEWLIVWKVGENKYSTTQHRESLTLIESMTEIKINHARGDYGRGKLSFGFIAKLIVEAERKDGIEKMSIELVEVPENSFLPDVHVNSPNPARMNEDQLREYRNGYKNHAFDDVRLRPQVEVGKLAAAA